MNIRPKVVVAQKGTREYFLAARALHRRGYLAQMLVDWYTPNAKAFRRCFKESTIASVSRAFAANSDEIPEFLIRRMPIFGIYARLYSKYLRKKRMGCDSIHPGVIFARRIAKMKLPPHDIFFGYSYSSLETLISEKNVGKLTILDQIDPGALEREIIRDEETRWPKYVLRRVPDFNKMQIRNKMEWDNADVVLVNSLWSKECIVKKGCDRSKVEILPLAYESSTVDLAIPDVSQPLKVLWLGRITLQKGIQYLVESAKLLANEPVEFYVAGLVDIAQDAIDDAPKSIKWLGSISVKRKQELYGSCHVFVLPTLSDGFAITQLEAFAHGLPVITTRHCGKVVTEGMTGYIVRARDPEHLAEAIMRFLQTPSLITEMGERCRKEVGAYRIDAYADGLSQIIRNRFF